jgi:hypothetical protein
MKLQTTYQGHKIEDECEKIESVAPKQRIPREKTKNVRNTTGRKKANKKT